jgi:RNA polymerase-binding protein DksA
MARTARDLANRTVSAAKRVTRKATADDSTVAKPAAKKAPAKKTAAKKTAAKKSAKTVDGPAEPAQTEQATAKVAAKKAPVAKAGARTGKKAAVRKAPAKTAQKAPAVKAAATHRAPARKSTKEAAKSLTVKPDETPWTTEELDEVRGELNADRERLRSELNLAEHELHDLMRDAGDGAGNDQADVGSTTFERDHEMSLANNARMLLAQTEHALARIDDGSYGVCESCGQPIGKMRLMAFPRATLCLSCKQREERR